MLSISSISSLIVKSFVHEAFLPFKELLSIICVILLNTIKYGINNQFKSKCIRKKSLPKLIVLNIKILTFYLELTSKLCKALMVMSSDFRPYKGHLNMRIMDK